jgi:Flp pilus assembly protein TadG
VAAVSTTARLRDERGLMGKIAIVWLLLFALFVVAAIDVGSIALTRFKVANAADKAAFAAASTYKDTSDKAKAFEAAQQTVQEEEPGAKIAADGFAIDAQGNVTVKVVKRAWSLLAGRLSQTKPYTKVSATSTSAPPTL